MPITCTIMFTLVYNPNTMQTTQTTQTTPRRLPASDFARTKTKTPSAAQTIPWPTHDDKEVPPDQLRGLHETHEPVPRPGHVEAMVTYVEK